MLLGPVNSICPYLSQPAVRGLSVLRCKINRRTGFERPRRLKSFNPARPIPSIDRVISFAARRSRRSRLTCTRRAVSLGDFSFRGTSPADSKNDRGLGRLYPKSRAELRNRGPRDNRINHGIDAGPTIRPLIAATWLSSGGVFRNDYNRHALIMRHVIGTGDRRRPRNQTKLQRNLSVIVSDDVGASAIGVPRIATETAPQRIDPLCGAESMVHC